MSNAITPGAIVVQAKTSGIPVIQGFADSEACQIAHVAEEKISDDLLKHQDTPAPLQQALHSNAQSQTTSIETEALSFTSRLSEIDHREIPGHLTKGLQEVFQEFLMNAFQHGTEVKLQFGYDNHFIGIECQDNGGSFTKERLKKALSRTLENGQVNFKTKGAGIGLFLSAQKVSHLMIYIHPATYTRVQAFVDLDDKQSAQPHMYPRLISFLERSN